MCTEMGEIAGTNEIRNQVAVIDTVVADIVDPDREAGRRIFIFGKFKSIFHVESRLVLEAVAVIESPGRADFHFARDTVA